MTQQYVQLDIDRNDPALVSGDVDHFLMNNNSYLVGLFNKQQLNPMCHGHCLLLSYILVNKTVAFLKKYTLVTDSWEVLADGDDDLLL